MKSAMANVLYVTLMLGHLRLSKYATSVILDRSKEDAPFAEGQGSLTLITVRNALNLKKIEMAVPR